MSFYQKRTIVFLTFAGLYLAFYLMCRALGANALDALTIFILVQAANFMSLLVTWND